MSSSNLSQTSDVAAEVLVLLGHDPRSELRPGTVTLEALRRCTRDQLLDYARRLGMSGVAKLTKDILAGRLQLALDELGRRPARIKPAAPAAEGHSAEKDAEKDAGKTSDQASSLPPKFDLGPDIEKKPTPQHIPWSYGQNRVTGMVVDPDRMFAYWECTDAAIDHARRGLGPAGRDAWLTLRIYDITGRLFDGTNAHSYFDHKIERSDRQWFFEIGRPTSVACIELGLKSTEGYFAKISRSGRVEFPRREPVAPSQVEWLTVHSASGDAGPPVGGGTPPQSGGDGGDGGAGGGMPGGGGGGAIRELHGIPEWTNGGGGPGAGGMLVGAQILERRWEWREGGGAGESWQSERASLEWVSPMIRSAWEAGPFTYPVQSPAYIEEWNDGSMSVRTEDGKVHIVYGPWQVVIRGIGAKAERRVLDTWEIRRTWWTTAGVERTSAGGRALAPGSSEWLALGASERSWMGGSELRLGGGSELFMLGASELRLFGASESLYTGASQWMMRGASENMYAGASEWLMRGSSENLYRGSSENLYAGASELRFEGASEHRLGYPGMGASENQLFPAGSHAHVKAKG